MSVPIPTPPSRKFEVYQPVKVPAEVHESRQAQIVGYEPGPNARKSCPTWVYFIRFAEAGMPWSSSRGEWWQATEEELVSWQGG